MFTLIYICICVDMYVYFILRVIYTKRQGWDILVRKEYNFIQFLY